MKLTLNPQSAKKFFPVFMGLFVIFSILAPETAHAATATTLGGLFTNIKANFSSFKNLAFSFGYLMGVILFVSGIWLVYKDSKQPGQDHAKKGGIALLVGVALLTAPTLIEIFGASTVGDAQGISSSVTSDANF